MKVLYTNTDGLLNKKDELLILIEDYQPEIIAITETIPKNVKDFVLCEYKVDNYDIFHNDNPSRGVALYFHKSINAQECTKLNKGNFKEAIFCQFDTREKERCLVGCIYKSPNSTEENIQNLYYIFKNNDFGTFDKICIMGDFNFPNILWNGCQTPPKEEEFVDATRDAYLEQMVIRPTRNRDGQNSNILDLVFVNEASIISDIDHTSPIGKSDHQVLRFSLYVNIQSGDNSASARNYNLKRGDFDKMRRYFADQDWIHLQTLDVEHCWQDIRDKVHKSMEENIPKMGKRTKNKKYSKTYWMSYELRKSVKKKYRLFKRYLESGRHKKGQKYREYVEERNKCARQTKKERKNHERDIAEKCKQNPKMFWKYINSRTKINTGIGPLKDKDGKIACDDKNKAEILNSYFSSVFPRENTNNLPNIGPKVSTLYRHSRLS